MSSEHIHKAIARMIRGKKKRPTSERAYTIQRVCDNIFSQDEFKKLMGATGNLTIDEITDIYDRSVSWKVNPKALFWKLLREKKAEIKKELEEEKEN